MSVDIEVSILLKEIQSALQLGKEGINLRSIRYKLGCRTYSRLTFSNKPSSPSSVPVDLRRIFGCHDECLRRSSSGFGAASEPDAFAVATSSNDATVKEGDAQGIVHMSNPGVVGRIYSKKATRLEGHVGFQIRSILTHRKGLARGLYRQRDVGE